MFIIVGIAGLEPAQTAPKTVVLTNYTIPQDSDLKKAYLYSRTNRHKSVSLPITKIITSYIFVTHAGLQPATL